ncbi:MAG: HAMP domain-containing protein [Desulfobacteraceae bacterium]|nr:HAMP domain-containing protein [Desulfobacteraceae bacterium]
MSEPDHKSTQNRRFLERVLVTAAFTFILSLGLLQGWFFQLRSDLPLHSNILLFAFINLNVLLLLLLAYLVLRNIVKLVFERKRHILGSRLKTRLVIASVGLTLIPAIPLFWLASQFIFSSLDHWFSSQVEKSLENSVLLAKEYVQRERSNLITECRALLPEIAKMGQEQGNFDPGIQLFFRSRIDALYIYDAAGDLKWSLRQNAAPEMDPALLKNAFQKESGTASRVINLPPGEAEAVAAHLVLPYEPVEVVIAVRILPAQVAQKLDSITAGYDNYLQLKMLHVPLKKSHFITFSIVTMLAIFAAVWFGFFLAKNLTESIQTMLSATQRIAEGDLDVRIEPGRQDEIGMLIASFNDMTRDLRESREKLDRAYKELQTTNVELEDRRRYMEIVLRNVAAGVVSVDAEGRVITLNKSAELIFGTKAETARGRHYSEFLEQGHLPIVESFMESYKVARQPYLERPAQVKVSGSPMSLFIKVSVLRDDKDQFMGIVVVLDDFTELEKAQRMAAWREVARRIAHEIKNPLTPIQLSAQRLRRKYPELVEGDGSVFDECTNTIIHQVDHMKHLVNEFSRFARLPQARLAPCSLQEIVEEGLNLYRHNYGSIDFRLEGDERMPLLRLDRDQFRQVIINLLDNAVYALGKNGGEIAIRLSYDSVLKIATLECADNGQGIAAENRVKVFEPYYSTKEKGTGLGLAIVSTIIADHNGFIRVRANSPRGTVFTIELPG